MDLMTLAAKITLDDSGYVKGVNNAEKMGQKLAGKMSAMTVAVGNLAADMIRKGVNGVQQIIGGAVDAYADYQQLIGGVETLFKGSSEKVAKYAQQAYKTTGLSANKYMETVTSFSASLLQGLGGNTEKAAELANMAVTDMSDNANKMGTDISMIQSAYQGFAKQNYTMLDNLKLGYGGTRGEMVRLINDSKTLDHEIKDLDGITFDQLVTAIHAIQTEMGITGTTAKEAANTISGSKNSLKAAWEDLLSTAGGEGDDSRFFETLENFKSAFSTYMENYIPSLVLSITSSGYLIDAVAEAVSALPSNLIAQIAEAGMQSGTEMFGGLSELTTWVIESITNVFKSAKADPSQIQEFGKAIGDFIGTAISDIATNAPAILDGMINAGVALAGGLVEGLFKGLFGEGAEVDKITESLQKEITDVNLNSAKASALVQYIQKLSDEYGKGVTQVDEFRRAREELDKVMPEAGKVFEAYGDDVQGAINKLDEFIAAMRRTAIQTGLTKALNEQYELLGEQQATKAQAEETARTYGYEKAGLQGVINETARAYAKEVLELNKENGIVGMDDRLGEVIANAQQTLETGESGNIGQLIEALQNSYDRRGTEESDTLWGKSLSDNILSPDEIAAFEASIAELQNGIDDANKAAQDAQKEIAETEKQIAITERAVNTAMEESTTGLAGTINSGDAAIASALTSLASTIGGAVTPGMVWKSFFRPHATGLKSVPYNGYKAELHRGEAILTKSENEERQRGSMDADEFATAMEDVLVEALSKVGLYVGKDRVADIVSNRVQGNIVVSDRARQRSMGG